MGTLSSQTSIIPYFNIGKEISYCSLLSVKSKYVCMVYLTIIPPARVGYEMIDTRLVGYNHLISNKRKWNNCFIKNNQEILLDLTDFAVQE